MYAICHIIYGHPHTQELADLFGPEELEEHGFEFLYSVDSDLVPGFIGVKLSEFDEASGSSRVSEIFPDATEEQKSEANKKIEALPEAIRKHVGSADNYLIWTID